MLTLFWIAIGFLLYTAFGYPALVWILSRFRGRGHRRGDIFPLITVIVPAHNEERVIGKKLECVLSQDYPGDKMEIIVVSDASTDRTVEIVQGFVSRGVKLINLTQVHGKHHGQLKARDESCGEILVFTDASVMLTPGSIRQIISNFADQTVGCVSSEDEIVGNPSFGETAYVKFEMWLRTAESQLGSTIGASGSFFAARRLICEDWHVDQSSDFFIPLHAAEHKLRVVVDSNCRAQYGITRSSTAEFHRKVRTVVHGLDIVATHRSLLNPFRHGLIAWQLISHKVFRWCIPFALVAVFVATLFLWNRNPVFMLLSIMQLACYAGGTLSLASDRFSRFKPCRFAGFFLLGNTATIVAWFKLCMGEKYAVWEPTRRS